MNTRESGYNVKDYHQPVKRYCQTLDLKNDSALIAEYVKRHADIWPEIKTGICEVGILEMQIFLLGTRLFMIVETPLDFDWDSAMSKLATLPRQAEWEEYMSMFQISSPGATSSEKWKLMDEIFHL
ncbi:L-rhamnose mutarotase [Bacteroides luti]|uniref:L-rhamnose mutarotase n=1 Tax=Bacteroides luti TaxID=1297750 RepID=A0A1M4W6P2_9BACE|nr:L-rhamnose mutarotase [Bacteroides luti]SHE76815.1 L-rhamnose mutarotase [Bacteroides luti]